MMLVTIIESRSAVRFLDRNRGFSGQTSSSAVCECGVVEAVPEGELLLQAMAGDGSYDPDIALEAVNDNWRQIGPIREFVNSAKIMAGA